MAAKKTTTAKKHSAVPPAATKKPAEAVAKAAGNAITAELAEAKGATATAVAEAPVVVAKTAPITPATPEMEKPKPSIPAGSSPAGATEPTAKAKELLAALRDPSAERACEAAADLGRLGERSVVEPLMAVVINTDSYYHSIVRAAAATSLGQLGDARAVPALIIGIHDNMAEASAESVRALAAIAHQSAIQPLVEVTRNVDGFFLPVVRRAAVLALAHFGGPLALQTLKTIAEDQGEDPVVRQTASDSLA